MTRLLPPESPLPAYLRRLLVTDTEVGKEIFARLYEMATATLSSLIASGVATPGDDPAVRAALLMANDLAVLLLRDRLTEVLQFDPLSGAGMARWATQVVAIYSGGLRPNPSRVEMHAPPRPPARRR